MSENDDRIVDALERIATTLEALYAKVLKDDEEFEARRQQDPDPTGFEKRVEEEHQQRMRHSDEEHQARMERLRAGSGMPL